MDARVTDNLLLLAHKTLGTLALLVGSAGVFTAIDFSRTITLGSILIGIVIVIISALFTIRSKIATIWREEAEGERAAKERLEEQLGDEKASRAAFEREQQELRHELKGKIAELSAQLQVMEAKTDLTTALETIKEMNETSVNAIRVAITESFMDRSAKEHAETHKLLGEIRDKLPASPIPIVDVTDDKQD